MSSNFVAIVPRFKFFIGPCCLIIVDAGSLEWMEGKFRAELNGASNGAFCIGDGAVIASDGITINIIKSNKSEENEIMYANDGRLEWKLGSQAMTVVADKLLGMINCEEPCHTYLEPKSGFLEEIIVSRGEYDRRAVRDMSA